MSSKPLAASLFFGICIFTLQAENLVSNGDFETGEGNAFKQTTGWYNGGDRLDQDRNARLEDDHLIAGTRSAVVCDRYDDVTHKASIAHIQKTSYLIEQGDSFLVNYEWRPSWGWDSWKDSIRFVVFATTDDTIGGSVVWSSELIAPYTTDDPAIIQLFSGNSDEVNSEAVGRLLFVKFHGIDTAPSPDAKWDWARLDNIEVTVLKNQ